MMFVFVYDSIWHWRNLSFSANVFTILIFKRNIIVLSLIFHSDRTQIILTKWFEEITRRDDVEIFLIEDTWSTPKLKTNCRQSREIDTSQQRRESYMISTRNSNYYQKKRITDLSTCHFRENHIHKKYRFENIESQSSTNRRLFTNSSTSSNMKTTSMSWTRK